MGKARKRREANSAAKAAPAGKLDLYKEHRDEYVARRKPLLVTVGPAKYLSIDGSGQPGGEAFQAQVGALYGAAFTIKMASKFAGRDYKVCPLEGLYWADDDGELRFAEQPAAKLNWKLMVRVPPFVRQADLRKAAQALADKGKAPQAASVALEALREGPCVQMLHVGPYAEEQRTLDAMRAFAEAQGLRFGGRHHEIYLSDPRRVAPQRLRTILRHPVRRSR